MNPDFRTEAHEPYSLNQNSLRTSEQTNLLYREDITLLTKVWGRGVAPKNAPEVLFVTGATHTHRTFDIVARILQSEMVIHSYDLRGHGDSGKHTDRPYRHEDYVADMAAVIENIGKSPMVVVASSMGGLHALRLAAEQPHLISQLVLVDILPMIEEHPINGLRSFFRKKFESWEHLETLYKGQYSHRSLEDVREELSHATEQTENGLYQFRFDRKVIDIVSVDQLRGFQSCVPQVQCPITLLSGEFSRVVSPKNVEDFCAALLKDTPFSQLVIPGGDHCPWRENPIEFSRLVTSIVTQN